MTENQINKILCEFMGWKFTNDEPKEFPDGYWVAPEGDDESPSWMTMDEMRYTDSWNWLRPVFDQWNSLGDIPRESLGVANNHTARIAHSLAYGKTEECASQLAYAINWYNGKKEEKK